MKTTIRTTLFETNSSSTHTVLIGPKPLMDKLQTYELIYIKNTAMDKIAARIKEKLQKEDKVIPCFNGEGWACDPKDFMAAWQDIDADYYKEYLEDENDDSEQHIARAKSIAVNEYAIYDGTEDFFDVESAVFIDSDNKQYKALSFYGYIE